MSSPSGVAKCIAVEGAGEQSIEVVKDKVFEQCLLCSAAQNMKKIALVVDKDDLLSLFRRLRLFWPPPKLYTWVSKGLDRFITNFIQIIFMRITTLEIENPA